MILSRIRLGRIAFWWAIFLWCMGMVLPNLDSRTQAHPAVKAITAVVYSSFIVGTPIVLAIYFARAWRRVTAVPNRTEYVIWMSLESIAGAGVFGFLIYAIVSFAAAQFH